MKLLQLIPFAVLAAARVHHPRVANITQGADETPDLGYQKLWDLQDGFWNRFMYPNNVKEATSINSTIFSDNVLGRVSDTRDFVGRELNTEYIFGLFIPTAGASIIGQPQNYEIIQFTANQNIAAASTRVNFTFPTFGNITYPIVIDTWLTWNSDNQITQYDVTFRWFAYLLETLLGHLSPNAQNATAMATGALSSTICATHTKSCLGKDQQYASEDDCLDFLTKQIRFGQSFELGMNTLLCRSVHEIMVPYRPDVHCPHIGPSGGGMCDDDQSYMDKVTEKYFVNAPFIPAQP